MIGIRVYIATRAAQLVNKTINVELRPLFLFLARTIFGRRVVRPIGRTLLSTFKITQNVCSNFTNKDFLLLPLSSLSLYLSRRQSLFIRCDGFDFAARIEENRSSSAHVMDRENQG